MRLTTHTYTNTYNTYNIHNHASKYARDWKATSMQVHVSTHRIGGYPWPRLRYIPPIHNKPLDNIISIPFDLSIPLPPFICSRRPPPSCRPFPRTFPSALCLSDTYCMFIFDRQSFFVFLLITVLS